MTEEILHFDPDPKVLIALTHTPLKPLDALCELIDNGIDSFRTAAFQGQPVAHPLLEVRIPGATEVRRGEGVVRLVDNGPGLDRESLENALRAGYSDKNRYDTLGLFGMGFNIATGKLGKRTVVTTARKEDDFARRVALDLREVVRRRKFESPVEKIEKPANFEHGTMVEVGSWWTTATQIPALSSTSPRSRKPSSGASWDGGTRASSAGARRVGSGSGSTRSSSSRSNTASGPPRGSWSSGAGE